MNHTEEYIEALVAKFLEGKTTEAEEKILSDFFCLAEELPPRWEEYRTMFLSFKTDAYDFSDAEIDAMFIPAKERKTKIVRMWTWLSVSVACVAASLVWVVMQPWKEPATLDKPRLVQAITQDTALPKDSMGNKEMESSQEDKVKKFLAEENSFRKERQARKERKTKQHGSLRKKTISTAELLETVNALADIGTENVTLTASPKDGSFVVKAVDVGGQSNSYTLRKSLDGSSLELVSQLVNF